MMQPKRPIPKTHSSDRQGYTALQIARAKSNGFRPYVVNPGKSRYTGLLVENKPDGHGTLQTMDGEIYDGQWKNGMRHGQGSLRVPMSDKTFNRIYVGQWKYDQKCGEGKQYFDDGVYYGWWNANKRDGLGIMWYHDGSQYVGQWKNSLWHGAGVLFQENGNRYEGFFENGQKHGEGIFYHLHGGQVQKGVWQKNICKVSMMFDCGRNQSDHPTPYPMPKNELSEPNALITSLFRQYLPSTQKIKADLQNRTCSDVMFEIKK